MDNELKYLLSELYLGRGYSFAEVGKELGVSNVTAKKMIVLADIPLRTHSENQKLQNSRKSRSRNLPMSEESRSLISESKKKDQNKPTKCDLLSNYNKPMSIADLERHYEVGTKVIRRWLKEYEIEIRPGGKTTALKMDRAGRYSRIFPSRDELVDLYQNMTIYEIAKHFMVDKKVAAQWIDFYGIDKRRQTSTTEKSLFDFVSSLCPDAESQNKNIISPYELDIYVPSKSLGIEYCGSYWHSSKFKRPDYHRKKYLMCKDIGVELLTVFEGDDIDKVKCIIQKKLGICKRIYARNCEIRVISNKEARKFNEKYHIHNHINASVTYGTFYDNELLQLMSFGKERFNKTSAWEILRFTNGNITVIGGASKLFNTFVKEYNPNQVITYSNLRFGQGKVYEKLQMKFIKETNPNYYYVLNGRMESRHQYQKHKLENKLEYYDSNLSEKENMERNNIYRIHDCGNAKYMWSS